MKFKVDLNCDLGESFGRYKLGSDEEIMPYITSANRKDTLHIQSDDCCNRKVNSE
jgi:UPF0271 protein